VNAISKPEPRIPDTYRRSRVTGLVQLALVMALAALASAALAETPPALLKYAGNYKYNGTREQGIEIIDKAVDKSMADVNMVMRLMIKRGIEKRFAETIAIEIPAGKIGIKVGDLKMVTTEIGKSETVKGEDGKTGKVTHTFDGAKITETVVGDDGTITSVYELDADGKTLHRSVTVNGSQMSKPLKYKLDYVRK
jgi:hypothetical protein